MPIVRLEPWEYAWAAHVGIARFTANWGKADSAEYDPSRMEDDRTAQVAAAICELAVARITNRYWGGHAWPKDSHMRNRNIPDVGRNIEVRRVRKPTAGAAVRKRQLGQGLVLFAAYPEPPEFRVVDVWGWLDHDEAWAIGEPAPYSQTGNTRQVPRHAFNTNRLEQGLL